MTSPKSLSDSCREALAFDRDYINEHWNGVATRDDFESARTENIRTAALTEALCLAVDALEEMSKTATSRMREYLCLKETAEQALADLRACVRKDEP